MGGSKNAGPRALAAAKRSLLRAALAYPEASLHHPWGEDVVKVRGKIFVFLGLPSQRLTVTVKLPESRGLALELPNTEPTGYGLGKAGWITACFEGGRPPIPMLLAWIEESYRAVAPKALVRGLSAPAPRRVRGRPGAPARPPTCAGA